MVPAGLLSPYMLQVRKGRSSDRDFGLTKPFDNDRHVLSSTCPAECGKRANLSGGYKYKLMSLSKMRDSLLRGAQQTS
jgi:hypothetical protein